MPRKAFTLLELVVTMAIISMLTAMITPAIQHARVAARRVSCASQIRALALGAAGYAQENNTWLPPGPRELTLGGKWAGDPDRGSPLELFSAARIGHADLSSQNGWYSQGLLWQQGAIDQPKLYYCPELATQGWGFPIAWPQNMPQAPDQAGEKSLVASSYVYRGGYASAAGSTDGPLNTTRNDGGEPLFADSPLYGTMWHPGGYVVGYLGGHAEFRTFAKPPAPGLVTQPLWDAVRENGRPTSGTGTP